MSAIYDKTLGFLAGEVIESPETSMSWSLGEMSKYKIRADPETGVEEVTGTCIATQLIEEPVPGEEVIEAIMKIRVQYIAPSFINQRKNPDSKYRITPQNHPLSFSREAIREFQNLQGLTRAGCTSTPRPIDHFAYKQHSEMACPGGYVEFVVMEKVHGQDLRNFGTLSIEERDSVRIAFIRALWEFRQKGFHHEDPRRENIIWDKTSQRCFIIDLEDAWDLELPARKRIKLDPMIELSFWNLNSEEIQPINDHSKDDPMMPEPRKEGWAFDDLDELVAFLEIRRCIS